jgi:hypothetical protein
VQGVGCRFGSTSEKTGGSLAFRSVHHHRVLVPEIEQKEGQETDLGFRILRVQVSEYEMGQTRTEGFGVWSLGKRD